MKLKLYFRKAIFSQPHTHNKKSILSYTPDKRGQSQKDYKELTPELLHYYFTMKKVFIPDYRQIQREARY